MEFNIFLWGFAGSIAVELLGAWKLRYKPPSQFPEYYKSITFYFFSLVMALMGGGLCLAHICSGVTLNAIL